MKKLIILVLFLLPGFISGQETKGQLQWNAMASAGLLTGESDTKPFFQLSGGLRYNRFFTGIGAGYDTYEFNSIPVFADWRVNLGKKQMVFLYGNAGYNFPGQYSSEDEFSKTSDRLRGGIYFDAGIGYRIPLGNLHRLALSAGFSRKDITQRKVFVTPCLVPPCPEDIHNYKYNFNRLLARLSWEIGKGYNKP
jgi:hypothetical protein